MKTKTSLICIFFCLQINVLFAQVGINTTNPNAVLDIQSTNQATPSPTDGILIPKIDEFPIVNPTVAQDGMLVYATGTGSVSNGFYSWNASTLSWECLGGELAKLNEGNGNGYRIKGANPNHFGSVGANAVDLSNSNQTNNLNGAIGKNSFAAGINCRAENYNSIAIGEGVVAVDSNEVALGRYNRIDWQPNSVCDYVLNVGYGDGPQPEDRKTALAVRNDGQVQVKNIYSAGPINGQIESEMAFDLRDGWYNYGGIFMPAAFYKDNERVYLTGLVRRSLPINPNTLIGILPNGYRPAGRQVFNLGQNGEQGAMIRVDVTADGRVRFMGPYLSFLHPYDYVSLAGISFRSYTPPQPPDPNHDCDAIAN